MGQRANFEEHYSGETFQGSYIAGVYYPDKTRVGWWKNGYPDYFAKVLNAADWTPIHVTVDGDPLDLATAEARRLAAELGAVAEREALGLSGGQAGSLLAGLVTLVLERNT